MDSEFFKFPRTPHLIWLSDKPARDDRVLSLSEAATFIRAELCIEEKIDGANIGISVEDGVLMVQNRGAYLEQPSAPQFRPLWGWLSQRQAILLEILGSDLVLFGEWCFAVHSARYDRLPDWFLGFDIYDRSTERFWSSIRRNNLLESAGISVIPEMGRGRFTLEDLRRMKRATNRPKDRLALELLRALEDAVDGTPPAPTNPADLPEQRNGLDALRLELRTFIANQFQCRQLRMRLTISSGRSASSVSSRVRLCSTPRTWECSA